MALYFILIFVFLIFSLFSGRKQNHILPIVSFVILFVISAFRKQTVGGDLQRYLPTFARVQQTGWGDLLIWNDNEFSFMSEFGFRYLQKVMGYIDTSNQFYIIFTSFFVLSIAIYAINKYSLDKALSIFIYVSIIYLNSFNIIRACLSVAICLLSYKYIREKKLLPFVVLMFLAISVQRTSIFFLPAYFLYNVKLNVKFVLVALVAALFFSLALTGSQFANFVNYYFSSFEISEDTNLVNESSSGLTMMAIFLLFTTILSIYVYRKRLIENKKIEFLIYMLVIATMIQFFSSVFILLNRISLFYYSYLIFLIPHIEQKCFRNYSRLSYKFLYLIAFLAIYSVGILKDTNGIIPYLFFWE